MRTLLHGRRTTRAREFCPGLGGGTHYPCFTDKSGSKQPSMQAWDCWRLVSIQKTKGTMARARGRFSLRCLPLLKLLPPLLPQHPAHQAQPAQPSRKSIPTRLGRGCIRLPSPRVLAVVLQGLLQQHDDRGAGGVGGGPDIHRGYGVPSCRNGTSEHRT